MGVWVRASESHLLFKVFEFLILLRFQLINFLGCFPSSVLDALVTVWV